MPYLFTVIILSAFWLLLSGHFTALLISFGAVSVALVVWFLTRMDKADGQPATLDPTPKIMSYWVWLLWAVVKANIDVVKRIWNPDLPIEPQWARLDTKVSTRMEKTLYANSITLTPGTLTTDVGDDHFMVHALSQEGIDELREGEMERRIRDLGI
jgi:multicomponent Na+:H+ antiporter subunit E